MAGTKGRSARGEKVDFDLMKIKAQLADAPKTIEVENREEVIVAKRKRVRKKKEDEAKSE